jgi:hypothetical protein
MKFPTYTKRLRMKSQLRHHETSEEWESQSLRQDGEARLCLVPLIRQCVQLMSCIRDLPPERLNEATYLAHLVSPIIIVPVVVFVFRQGRYNA